ncbi:MAG: Crp/Fnr family transcriptional regulator [Bacilli bacterium]|nr:Crp/Fnr family transcriptional regulator [Bacilli bacterium]
MENLFENISSKNREKLLKMLKSQAIPYRKGVNILSNVNRDNFIGIVDEGSLQIVFNDYNGNSIIIEDIEKNQIFGNLISSINSDECEVITKEKTKIIYIDYDNITSPDVIKTDFYISFVKNLIKLMATQLNNKNERIEILTKRSIRDKLLEYFRILSKKKGSKIFTIPFSFIELANYLSVDRSAMTRELKYLKTEGFIKVDGKRVRLLY